MCISYCLCISRVVCVPAIFLLQWRHLPYSCLNVSMECALFTFHRLPRSFILFTICLVTFSQTSVSISLLFVYLFICLSFVSRNWCNWMILARCCCLYTGRWEGFRKGEMVCECAQLFPYDVHIHTKLTHTTHHDAVHYSKLTGWTAMISTWHSFSCSNALMPVTFGI